MKVYVKNVPDLGITTTLSDKELIVMVQAYERGLFSGKIRVSYYAGERWLDIAAIDIKRTLPRVVFEKPSIIPPPLLDA